MTRKRKGNCHHRPANMQKHARFLAPEDIPPEHAQEVDQLFKKTFQYTSLHLAEESSKNVQHGKASSKRSAPHNLKKRTVEDWFSVEEPQGATAEVCPADPELMRLKEEMNSVKDQLSNKDIQTWHEHTTRCNIAGKIIPHVRALGVELCTQAWVKFYEILCTYSHQGLVPDSCFLSVHLCEAPGAFITALNDFLQQRGYRNLWDWRATTLNPYHESNQLGEMVSDDRLIRQTYTQWFFGEDGSGDITHPGHVKDLRDMVRNVAEEEELKILLVTADGSKDCQANPAEQESLVSRLHHCEALAAALVLAPGGALVIKVFTLFEKSSVLLVFLLNLMFDQVHAKKPGTSKSGNSEVYLICMGYRKNVTDETLWKLLDMTVYKDSEGLALHLLEPLPASFVEEHRLCCQSFAKWQLETIHTNLRLYDHMTQEQGRHVEEKQSVALGTYLQKYGLANRQRRCRRVAPMAKDKSAFFFPPTAEGGSNERTLANTYHETHCPRASPAAQRQKHHSGTFQRRQNLSTMPWSERLDLMEFRDASQPWLTVMQCKNPIQDSELDEWTEVDTGQAFSVVKTSSLCDVSLLTDLNLLLEHSDYERCRQWNFTDHGHWVGATAARLLFREDDTGQLQCGAVSSAPPAPLARPSQGPNPSPVFYWDEGENGHSALFRRFVQETPESYSVTVISSEHGQELGNTLDQGPVFLFCNVTSYCDANFRCSWSSRCEELMCKAKFALRVAGMLKNLPPGSDVVLLTPTFLTRLTSSLLYLMARCFVSVRLESTPNLWLHQLVRLQNYRRAGPDLLAHVLYMGQRLAHEANMQLSQDCLMEVVSFPIVVDDCKFVRLLTLHNNRSLSGFINLMLEHMRGLAGEAGPRSETDSFTQVLE